jgi:hypothetical protein
MGARWIISLRRRTAVGPRGRRGAYRQGSIVRGQSAGPCAKRAEPKLRPGGERSRAPNGLLNPKRSGSSSLGLDLQRSCRDFVPFQGSPPLPDQTGASVSWFRVRVRSLSAAWSAKPTSPRRPIHPQSVLFSAAAGGAPLRAEAIAACTSPLPPSALVGFRLRNVLEESRNLLWREDHGHIEGDRSPGPFGLPWTRGHVALSHDIL